MVFPSNRKSESQNSVVLIKFLIRKISPRNTAKGKTTIKAKTERVPSNMFKGLNKPPAETHRSAHRKRWSGEEFLQKMEHVWALTPPRDDKEHAPEELFSYFFSFCKVLGVYRDAKVNS